MPYEVFIKDQKTGETIHQEIETLKELKELLLLYQEKLIDVELKKTSTKKR